MIITKMKDHNCGELNLNSIDKEVTLSGWVSTIRDLGGILFIELRDRSGHFQLVANPQINPDVHQVFSKVRSEYVITVKGKVSKRPEETYNEKEIGKVFNTSHNNSYYIYRYLVSDLYGIKKSFYKIADFISKSNFKYSENTFTKEIDVRILNNEKLTWYNPKSKDETYSYSFEELYQFTQDICIYLCNNAYEVLNNKLDIEDFIKLINSINLNNLEEFKKD